MSSNIEERVKKIVAEQLGVKLGEVTNDASFVEDLRTRLTAALPQALHEFFWSVAQRVRYLVQKWIPRLILGGVA